MSEEFKFGPGFIPSAKGQVPSTKDLKPVLTANQLFEACDSIWMYQMDGRMHANVQHKSLVQIIEQKTPHPIDKEEPDIIEEQILNEFDWELKLIDGTLFHIPDQELSFGVGIFYEFPQETRFNHDTFVNLKTITGEVICVQFWFTIPHNVDQIWDYLDRQADYAMRGQKEHQDVTIDQSDDTSHLEPEGGDDVSPLDGDFQDTHPGDL